jgi:hypothetical protein
VASGDRYDGLHLDDDTVAGELGELRAGRHGELPAIGAGSAGRRRLSETLRGQAGAGNGSGATTTKGLSHGSLHGERACR